VDKSFDDKSLILDTSHIDGIGCEGLKDLEVYFQDDGETFWLKFNLESLASRGRWETSS